jgi:ABC-type multidrug transport system ATPase subunit
MKKPKCVPIDEVQSNLAEWFKKRPEWLQDATRRFLENGALTPGDVEELTLLCKKEAGVLSEEVSTLLAKPIASQSFGTAEKAKCLRLDSISEIKGINNLTPRKPLQFGAASLTIIYGLSGSGKSGYMRILKRACGAKGIKPLHGNVFAEVTAEKSCKIGFTIEGTKKELVWTPESGVNTDLVGASLYDTDCAHVYVNEENQVTYEPPVLRLFRLLVEVCEKVDGSLACEITSAVSRKPSIDADLATTSSAQWYNKIDSETPEADVVSHCAWEQRNEEVLHALRSRLTEINPAEKAAALKKTRNHLTQLLDRLRKIKEESTDEIFHSFVGATEDAKTKRHAASVDAEKVFNNSPLPGIGSESWRLLWQQAKQYSETEAYKQNPFPYTETDAKCLLCQQDLDRAARERFVSFEEFVKGNLEQAANAAEKVRDSFFEKHTAIPQGDVLSSLLDLAGLTDDALRDELERYCDSLVRRRAEFITATSAESLMKLPSDDVLTQLSSIADELERRAISFEEDAKTSKKEELTQQVRELFAQKWLSQQRTAIEAEMERLKEIHLLQKAQSLTHTRALSEKKAELSDVLVTEAFRGRFDEELQHLRASRLKVTLERSQTHKGQVFHHIKLKDAKQPVKTGEILSEGEFRVVSIAAFLADVEGRGGKSAFVFDDPISSLDQPFEEATAERLVSLAKTRQVIVFTHRLSMMVLLEDAALKQGVDVNKLSLRSEVWGAGEPDETPIWAKKPESVINTLLGGRLAAARKQLNEEGRQSYEPIAKEICSEIRIAVERMVEVHLLNDVVHRFRRAVQTQNRIDKLAKIRPEDCKFVDDLMTKYSRYEHSQSNETPTPPPDPDEIEEDLNQIRAWFDEFKKRPVPTPVSAKDKSESHAA